MEIGTEKPGIILEPTELPAPLEQPSAPEEPAYEPEKAPVEPEKVPA